MCKHTFYYFLGNKKYPEIYILQFHLPGAGSNDDLSPGQVEGDLAAPWAFETGLDLPRQRNHGEELHGQVL